MKRISQIREIAPGVVLITSGSGAFASNLYFVRSGSARMLVDTGWAASAEQVHKAVQRMLGPGENPRAILLTHLHPDHSGAAGTLARLWQVPVYVHPAELPMAQGRYRADFSMPLDRWVVMPVMRSLPAPVRRRIEAAGDISDVVQPLGPGREVPGLPGWNAVPTPGHTPGHVAFWRPSDRVLLSGDAVVTVNLNSLPGILLGRPDLAGPPWYTTWDWKVAMESVDRLANLGPRLLAPGHGRPLALDVVSRLHALAGLEAKQRTRLSQARGGLRAT
jgi:glyoxylase-like metal-dependent hydrolase (beta-lactamase superfamily II)